MAPWRTPAGMRAPCRDARAHARPRARPHARLHARLHSRLDTGLRARLAALLYSSARCYPVAARLKCRGLSLNGRGLSLNGRGLSLNGRDLSLNGRGLSLNGRGLPLNGRGYRSTRRSTELFSTRGTITEPSWYSQTCCTDQLLDRSTHPSAGLPSGQIPRAVARAFMRACVYAFMHLCINLSR